MKIREKILIFLKKEDIEVSEIANRSKLSQPTISNYLNGKRQIPLSFIVWLLEEFPQIDARKLFDPNETGIEMNHYKVSEERASYGERKQKIIDKISKALDDFANI